MSATDNEFAIHERRVAGMRYLRRADVIDWLRWEAETASEEVKAALLTLAKAIEDQPWR